MFCPQSIPQIYEITIKRQLPHYWEDWFEGMKICDRTQTQLLVYQLLVG